MTTTMAAALAVAKASVAAAAALALAAGTATASESASDARALEPVAVKVLSQLDRFEPFEGHLFHEGRLWVGRSRKDLGAFYRLEVFDAAGTKVAEKELKHSLRYITPYGAGRVLVVGLGTDQLSHFTVASLSAGGVTLEERTIPLGALADRYVGGTGTMQVFTDPGGFDDPDHPTPPSQPLQTLFALKSGRVHWLKPHFSLPQSGLVIGSKLYILTSPAIGAGNRTLRIVDLVSEEATVVTDKLGDATKIVHLPTENLLAISDRGTGEVLFLDLKTMQISRRAAVEDGTNLRALTAYGHCVAVGIEGSRRVHFYDARGSETVADGLVASWDLSAAGPDLMALKELSADQASGRVFARSAYACSPVDASCGPLRNGVVLVQPETGSQAVERCLD
jgi:hypothetical protein